MNLKTVAVFLLRLVGAYFALLIVAAVLYYLNNTSLSTYEIGTAIRESHLREWLVVAALVVAVGWPYFVPIKPTVTRPPSKQIQQVHVPQKQSNLARIFWAFVTILGLAITSSVFKACHEERTKEQEAQRVHTKTTVWIPNPLADGRMWPYADVEILSSSTGYIKFRMADGRVIEQSGQYQVQTESK